MVYFVPTPIGNLKDISYRAVETLQAVDLIACEDTRHSLKLLNHYGIKKPLLSFHKFNERAAAEKLIALAADGKSIAVISDAGTPLISDPGEILTKLLIENNIPYTALPGATAFVPALLLSGMPLGQFSFIGFLPPKRSQKIKLLDSYRQLGSTLIIYSAPQDVEKDIKILFEVLGDRRAAVVRELSKIYESRTLINLSGGYGGELRGEFVIVVEGGNKDIPEMTEREHIEYYIEKGFDKKTALKMAAADRGVSKSSLYKYTIE